MHKIKRFSSNVNKPQLVKTAILMLNMGGPSSISEVKPFLTSLFNDNDLMRLKNPFYLKFLSKIIVQSRLNRIKQNYKEIGGFSPILKWTNIQGLKLTQKLNNELKNYSPFKHYIAFRYTKQNTSSALDQMKKDGVERAIAFLQYPHFSCTTSGSSLNELWNCLKSANMEKSFKWSLIDRWPLQPKFIETIFDRILSSLKLFSVPEKAIIIFSAHSLPTKIVDSGDSYIHEVHRSVSAVMEMLRSKGVLNVHYLGWQSKIGFTPWHGPHTDNLIKGLGQSGHKSLLIVPITFTSDHIETLHEIDILYSKIARENYIEEFYRTESPNESPIFIDSLFDSVVSHLESGKNYSEYYPVKCAGCQSPNKCRNIINPAFK